MSHDSARLDERLETATPGSDPCQGAPFRSILFPPGLEGAEPREQEGNEGQGTGPGDSARPESGQDTLDLHEPGCFVDLNLDKIVAAVVTNHDVAVLLPFFYTPHRSEAVVRYRQAVFADLEDPLVVELLRPFSEAMRFVRADLDYARQIMRERHRQAVVLRAVNLYCGAVAALCQGLDAAPLRSTGLLAFRAYLNAYAVTEAFTTLRREAGELRELLSNVSYNMRFHDDKVTVRRYTGESNYAVTVLERFARFTPPDAQPPAQVRPSDEYSLNHIEEEILEFVGRLFPDEFGRLADFIARSTSFVDGAVARFEREIGFYTSYLAFIAPLKRSGLVFCLPAVSESSKETEVVGGFDLALADKLRLEGGRVVRNDFRLMGAERLLVVSGPNQGGKTTFARMFGQLHYLASLGCPVPAEKARLFLCDRLFTHFEREEDIANLRGKLEEELVRLHETCERMTSASVVVLNEIFNSTGLDDQVFLSTEILRRILAADIVGVCVTFIDALSKLGDKTVSMVGTVEPDDPARRTFRIVRRPADGLAYALALARKRGVTYEQLRLRVLP